MTPARYPLSWPAGWIRTPRYNRQYAQFGTRAPGRSKQPMTIGGGCARLMVELGRLGVRDGDAVLSTNLRTRLDGLPCADQAQPDDCGVALYFRLKGQDRVLACDRWTRVADNITAIAAHIDALRAVERYGVGSLEQAFAGYQALPAKGTTWRTTLGFALDQVVTLADVHEAFRARARGVHPDVPGGNHDAMASLTAAKRDAIEELTRA